MRFQRQANRGTQEREGPHVPTQMGDYVSEDNNESDAEPSKKATSQAPSDPKTPNLLAQKVQARLKIHTII